MADVKASVALTADGRLQGFIGGSATNLGPVRIKTIQMQASAADAEVKIYDNDSTNGVYINNDLIENHSNIKSGDKLQIGKFQLLFTKV